MWSKTTKLTVSLLKSVVISTLMKNPIVSKEVKSCAISCYC